MCMYFFSVLLCMLIVLAHEHCYKSDHDKATIEKNMLRPGE